MKAPVNRKLAQRPLSQGSHPAARLLVVDGSEVFRVSTCQILTLLSYVVLAQAGNGLEAVALARSLEPDLILMDIEMPELDGIAAARQIQEVRPSCC